LDINQPTLVHGPPLYLAAARGHDALVQFLLESNANIEGEEPSNTAIKIAAFNGYMTTVQLLLDHGANSNARFAKEGTVVVDAAYQHNIPMIMLLLEHGAKLNLAGTNRSPLSCAAKSGGEKIVKLLLEHGAPVEVDSINALEVAIDRGKEDIVRTILHHVVDFDHALALSIVKAAKKGHFGLVDLLLKHDVDINSVNSVIQREPFGLFYISKVFPNAKHMVTPLSEAARNNRITTVKLLLDQEAKPNVNGGQALQSSIGNSETAMELLLKHGADVNSVGGKYGSTLNAACSKNEIDIVRRFIELRANINAPMSKANSFPIDDKPLIYVSQVTSTEAHFM